MTRKKEPEERKPDLAVPDQEALEERVKAMLDIEEDTPKKEPPHPADEKLQEKPKEQFEETEEKPTDESESVTSAPTLPVDNAEKPQEPKVKSIEVEHVDSDKLIEEEPQEKILNLDEAPKDKAIVELSDDEDSPEVQTDGDSVDTEEDVLSEKTVVASVIEDDKTSKAVDEIVAKEADAILDAEDGKIEKKVPEKSQKGDGKLKRFFKAWWSNPKARWATIIVVLTSLIMVGIFPASRYYVLNTVGVRSSASITVVDESTGQPLKNVDVAIEDSVARTDVNGYASLAKVKLGPSQLIVKKRAFAESTQDVTIKIGTNKLPNIRLKPTGVQYSFVVTDYLAAKPIAKTEAISGDASAVSDDKGNIKLTVDNVKDVDELEVTFKKEGYRDEKLHINTDDKSAQKVVLVPSRKHIFVSKRSGKYDVYSIYIDGKDEKLLLPGTGYEHDDVALAVHPSANLAALVSTRNDKTNKDNFRLSTLTVLNSENGDSTEIGSSERIQLIDWIGYDLIYVQATEGASATSPNRNKLMSYNYKTKEVKQLASSNYFNDVIVAGGKIYYAPSSTSNPQEAKLFRVNSDGSQKTVIVDQEVWNVFRTDYENLLASANQTWFNIRIGEDKATSASSQPTNPKSRIYVSDKSGINNLWVDKRDGKGVLLNYHADSRDEQVLRSQDGISNPVYWLNDRVAVYRVTNQQETADYVLSLDGGEAHKIKDVTNTNSLAQWYFY